MPNDKTLLGVLVIIFVVAGAAMLALAFRTSAHPKPREWDVQNQLRRIVEAQIGYSSDCGTWAYPAGFPVPDGSDPAATVEYVGRCFVLLAKANELSSRLFTDPHSPVSPGVDFPFMLLTYEEIIGGVRPSGTPMVLDRAEALRWAAGFAYDYTAPQNSSTGRPIIGERNPEFWDGKGVSVAYGDGHCTFVAALPTTESGVPQPETPVVREGPFPAIQTASNVRSTEHSVDDWIYNFDPHLGEHDRWAVGRGSATLAWLR